LIKVDCAEFQHSHEISKLLGSPPGYVGGEVPPVISKKTIEAKWEGTNLRYSVILFDEVEKAHNSFHQLLLGAMDRGYFTTGKNEKIDLTKCIIVMTSNLGSGEVKKLLKNKGYGFIATAEGTDKILDDDIYEASKKAVTSFFSPEFFNRIDSMIVFRALTDEVLRQILEIELKIVQDRVIKAGKFIHVDTSARGKELLIVEGTSKEFGARHLRRAIERFLVSKLTRALATRQAEPGDMILADHEPDAKHMVLEIMKGAMELPVAKKGPTAPAVKQPKAVFVTPSDPYASVGYPSTKDPDYCGRCGFHWYDKHACADLTRGDSALERFRREMEKRRKKP
jgi:ATP-dependent Clp protease ATP-binding subunit ClpB